MARELGIQFAEALEMAIDRGRPLPESASDIIENIDTPALHGWLRHFDIRDKLLLRAPQFEDLQSRARRFRKSGALSLRSAVLQWRRVRRHRTLSGRAERLQRSARRFVYSMFFQAVIIFSQLRRNASYGASAPHFPPPNACNCGQYRFFAGAFPGTQYWQRWEAILLA